MIKNSKNNLSTAKKCKLILVIVLILITSCFFTGCTKTLTQSEISEIIGTDKLPTETIHGSFAIDSSSLKEVVGDSDYVFIAEIKSYESTSYLSNDFPRTKYKIEVIKNIKGNLILNNSIELEKEGGIDKKHKKFIFYKDDTLPKVGECYLIIARCFVEGGDIVSGGQNSTFLISKTNYKDTETYKNVTEAYKNEITGDRTRYHSKYEI